MIGRTVTVVRQRDGEQGESGLRDPARGEPGWCGAILTGAVGIFGMRVLGMDVTISVRSTLVVGNLVGGVIFGIGMAVLGYCPGTAMGAAGDGSRHAVFGILGGIVGAGLYAESYPFIGARFVESVDLGQVTLASAADISPWWVIMIMAIIAVVGFLLLERWERSRSSAGATESSDVSPS